MNYAVHPGSLIKMLLMSSGKKQKWLANEMGVSKVVISELIHGKRSVTPSIAIAFEKAIGYPAENLVRLQVEYDLFVEKQKIDNKIVENFVSKWVVNEKNNDSIIVVEHVNINYHYQTLAV